MRAIANTITFAVLFAGCQSVSTSHYCCEIRLTRAAPTDERLGVSLVRVEPEGAAVIAVKETQETLRAMPGQPFLVPRGGEGDVPTFGYGGLILRSTDGEQQSAVLERRWARTRHGF